jgi:hypothetical protein
MGNGTVVVEDAFVGLKLVLMLVPKFIGVIVVGAVPPGNEKAPPVNRFGPTWNK